ncbi:hypothetical protein PIB30_097848 [Stylosanthes scabra]|uniref:Uncharacterized protein n=1 Tax=Stylosanthes scabra TaxID=79078 RepID=A0ABU6VYA8_9FABA|nr:hypothetical protein [Stylosanthes scabra]
MRHRLVASWCFFYMLPSAPSWQLLASIGASLGDLHQSPPFFSIADFFSSLILLVAAGFCCSLEAMLRYVLTDTDIMKTRNGKTSTKGSAPLQLVPLLGTLANCCPAHVFRRYPRRTPAKSTDTA